MCKDSLSDLYHLVCKCDWKSVKEVYDTKFSGKGWVFRGQGNASWRLQPTLERKMESWGKCLCQAPKIEENLLRDFKRKAHHYIVDTPSLDDDLEWLALMQHYGAPTRLLDFTYSFYTALFFAIESASPKENGDAEATVWALNSGAMEDPFQAILQGNGSKRIKVYARRKEGDFNKPNEFRAVFMKASPPLYSAAVLTPYRMNKRLTIQQGTFLVAGNISQSLECNLIKLLEERKKIDEKENAGYSPKENFVRLNIRVNTETRMEILHRLRDMNITKATLFPDLSGLAESLNTPPESILSI